VLLDEVHEVALCIFQNGFTLSLKRVNWSLRMKVVRIIPIVVGVLLFFSRAYAQEKVAIIMPQLQLEVGETRTVDAFIKCISGTCSAFEATIGFDPTIMEVEAAELGPFLGDPSLVVANEVNNTDGSILMAATALGDAAITDTTVLLSMTVKALSAGVSRLGVDELVIGDPVGNALDAAAFDGNITVSGEPLQAPISGTVTYWGYPNADKAMEVILPSFHQVYPDIEVQMNVIDINDHHDRLKAALESGQNVPDIAAVHHGRMQEIINVGGLTNLSSAPFDAGQYAGDFVDWIWQVGSIPDGQVGIPTDIGPGAFFYRRDLFEAAGLPSDPAAVAEMTRTWEGFLAMCEQLADPANNRYCMGTANDIVFSTLHIGRFFDENGQVLVNQPKVIQLVEYAKRMRQAGLDAGVNTWSDEWEQLFINGSIAVQYNGSWMGGSIQTWMQPEGQDWSGDWGVFPVPEDPGQNRGGSLLVVPEQSQNKEAAWALIQFMQMNAASTNAVFVVLDGFPAYKPAYDDPIFQEPLPFYGGQPVRELWRDIALETTPLHVTPYDDQSIRIMGSWLGDILYGEISVEEGVAAAAAEIGALMPAS
jgi:multiple sugar transport system substrate-binding protein